MPQRETEKTFDQDLNLRGNYVDRPTQLLNFSYTDDPLYPIAAVVKNKFSNVTSVYRCKYLIGSDGASSTTRRLLGVHAQGMSHDDVWLVADLQLETDFPDSRRRAVIRTPAGAVMIIPNAGGANRIYTQLSPEEAVGLGVVNQPGGSKTEDLSTLAAEWKDTAMLNILRTRFEQVLKPYKGKITKLYWISQYRIRQRVSEQFSDGARVFIMGDACHTHSPKAAQGLNVSMMDAYNLTWKLALVLDGKMRPELLETYSKERKQIAEELIDFDSKFSHLFAKKEFLDNNAEFHEIYDKSHGFTTGVGIHYQPNALIEFEVDIPINTNSLEPLTPGRRLYTLSFVRHIDGTAVNMLDEMPSNGRFHLVIFAGNALSQSRLASCAEYLNSAGSVLTRYSSNALKEWVPENIRHSSPKNNGRIVDLFLVHTDNHYDFDLTKLPAPLPDWQHRIYVDRKGKEHEDHGVDPNVGVMTLVRPDGYVSMITGLDRGPAITKFMDSFMITRELVYKNGN